MRDMPRYFAIESTLLTTVTLDEFWAELGDPVAAWIKVENEVHLQVLAPQERPGWPESREARFRAMVRELAATYPFDRAGQVSVFFDPPQGDVDDETTPPGEPVG
jgi:hypothetical protein